MSVEQTVAELAPELIRFCTGLSRDPGLGEEAAQEALTALVRHWRRDGPPESPRAFAFTVARRQARRALWRKRLFVPLNVNGHGNGDGGAGDPERSMVQRMELARTLRALGRLSTRDREALLLAAGETLATAEAARLLGLSVSAFKMRVHRARRRLSRYLEGQGAVG